MLISQLYNTCVCPVSDFAAAVRCFTECMTGNTELETFVLAISGDMGWEPPNIRQKYEMLHVWRLTKYIFNWNTLLGS